MHSTRPWYALALLVLALAGCAHGGGARGPAGDNVGPNAPVLDSVTTTLWHLDETVGPRVFDSGPFRLEGVAGLDTRSEFGRFQRARSFQRLPESFVMVPENPELIPEGAYTIEAWVRLDAYSDYEMTFIAGCWSPVPNEQSWMLGVVGLQNVPLDAAAASPGSFLSIITGGAPGQVVFAFQPAEASAPRTCFSSAPLQIGVWTHVAVTSDGQVVQLFLDGVLDNQCIAPGHLRASQAPLVMGAYLDERRLSTFAGDLRLDPGADQNAWYSLVGAIDEMRLSSVARTKFESSLIR